mgnify:CR=1 FL=1
MKAAKFSVTQKGFIVKRGEERVPVAEICLEAGISQATYFNWRKKYAGLMPSEMKRLRELEQENARLKKSGAICPSTRKCSRISSNESSEACPEKNAGRQDAVGLVGIHSPRLRGDPV